MSYRRPIVLPSENQATKMHEANKKVQYLVALSVSLTTITLGVSSSWPALVIPKFHDNQTNVDISDNEISWMLAMAAPGFMSGSLATRFVSDNFGRRTTILGSAFPIAFGTIILACARKAWLIYITRYLWGCGTGMISTVVGVYFSEVADKDVRGSLSITTKFMFNLGNLLMMSIGTFVSYQTLTYMMLVLPIASLVACWWIPESPYYHLKDGRVSAARRQLLVLRKYKDEKAVEDELIQMQADVRNEMRRSSSVKELFTGKQYRKAILIATGLKLTQIMTGMVTVQQYLGRIMQESKSTINLTIVFIVYGAVTFIVGIMSSVLADRVGRRPLLFYSYFGTSLSLAAVGIYFFMQEVMQFGVDTLSPYGFIPFLGILSANVISTLGFNSLIVLIPAEIFPLNVKTVAMTSLSIFGGILGFTVAKGYQELKDISGLCGVFWSFSAVSLLGAMFALFVVPETKGKSLKDIQILLQGKLYEEYDDIFVKNATAEGDGTEAKELKTFNVNDSKETNPV